MPPDSHYLLCLSSFLFTHDLSLSFPPLKSPFWSNIQRQPSFPTVHTPATEVFCCLSYKLVGVSQLGHRRRWGRHRWSSTFAEVVFRQYLYCLTSLAGLDVKILGSLRSSILHIVCEVLLLLAETCFNVDRCQNNVFWLERHLRSRLVPNDSIFHGDQFGNILGFSDDFWQSCFSRRSINFNNVSFFVERNLELDIKNRDYSLSNFDTPKLIVTSYLAKGRSFKIVFFFEIMLGMLFLVKILVFIFMWLDFDIWAYS